MAGTVSIAIDELQDLITRRLGQVYPEDQADRMADIVLFGELVGRQSHGIGRLFPGTFGPMDEQATDPQVDRLGPTTARVTGGPGMLVASIGEELVGDLAAEHGVATVATTGSHSTSGSLGYFAERLARRGLISFVTTNTVSFVAPPGGHEKLLGTNPIAFGVPTAGRPFVLDFATSAIAGGSLLGAAAAGDPLPDGVAVDAAGAITTDARSAVDGGALLPFGGHKGLGLSMLVQVLTGMLGGGGVPPLTAADDWSHVFIAIDLTGFGDLDELKREATAIVDRIAATPMDEGAEVRIPGTSFERRDAALASGFVEVDAASLDRLRGLL